QDASIVILRNKDIDIDASIVALRTTNNNQDTSIGILNNWNVSQDASIGLINTDITNIESSLGVLNNWNVSQDASIVLKANLNTSIVEVSTAYTVLSSDNNKVIEADASLVITLPDSLSTGFQLTIVNASTGYVSIDASTVLSRGSYKILKEQYAGASAVHKGSGTWYVWGGLS
nr:hypothetical protein [Candidatus Paceibacterota bacterium]